MRNDPNNIKVKKIYRKQITENGKPVLDGLIESEAPSEKNGFVGKYLPRYKKQDIETVLNVSPDYYEKNLKDQKDPVTGKPRYEIVKAG